jgi:hypothetical protein
LCTIPVRETLSGRVFASALVSARVCVCVWFATEKRSEKETPFDSDPTEEEVEEEATNRDERGEEQL